MNNIAGTFPLCILEEIGFEGLEGITIEGLWKRISVRIKVQLPLRAQIKKQTWNFILGAKCLRFYLLPEERDPLKLFDRTEASDPFFGGTETETENSPYTVYKYNPISTDTIRGSCEHFETRQERSKDMFNGNSVDDIEKEYGRRLVIVASQSLRDSLLLPPTLASDVEITILRYCILERLGRARFNGELAQGKCSLSDISGDPVAFHFQKKKLLQHKLIECQSYNQHIDGTNIFGQLIHLPRFSAIFKPRHIVVLERIIEILKSKPNFMAEYQDLKSYFDAHTNSFLRRFFKSSFFQKYVLTDTRLPYRAVYPNATEKEWKTKNNAERSLHVLQLKDPNIDPSEFYIQKEVASDNENETDDENIINRGFLDASQEVIGISILHQIYEYIKSSKAVGVSEQEIGIKFGQSKLNARALVRKLSKQCKLEFYTVNRQRQNVRTYVLAEFNKHRKKSKAVLELSDDEQICSQTEETSDVESAPIEVTLKTEVDNDPSQSEVTGLVDEESADDKTESQTADTTAAPAEDGSSKLVEQIDGEIITTIKEIKQTEYCRKSKKRPISDELISERNESRVQFMLREIKRKELFDDPTKLFMALKSNEESQGATDTMCKKTFYRLLTYMCSKQLIRLWSVQFQYKSKYQSITFVTSKTIDSTYSLITSCIDQARSKFQLNIHDEVNRREAHKLRVMKVKKVSQTKASTTIEHAPRINANLNKSLNYGSTPKFVRLRTLHEFLFYLVYEYKGVAREEPIQDEIIKQLKENSTVLLDDIEQMPTIWTAEPGWKMFIPPLIPHNGFDEGWCFLSDCIFRMPLSIFVRTINLSYEIPGLDEYLVHPIKKHFLIKDLPVQMQKILYQRRKHIATLHDFMRRLACIGLIQIGPHRSQKDQSFYYLNRFASLYDTSSSEQGLYYVSDMDYPVKRYQLKSLENIYTYWDDMHSICMSTKLNRKSLGDGNTPYEKIFPERLLVHIKPIQQRQAKQRDRQDCQIPGDRRGAAGLDSHLFAHLERNWSFNKTSQFTRLHSSQSRVKSTAAPIRCNRIVRVTRDPNLKKRITGVTTPVPLHKLKSSIVRRRVPITRKKMVVTKKRIYNKYDEIDRLALQNMNKLRVDWNQQEDNCLLLCKVAQMYLNPNNRLVMPSQVIRDILHWSCKSMNKTALACRRRISYITKKLPNSDQINNSILMCLNEIKENKSIQKRFGAGMIRNLKKIYFDEHELFNAFRIHFIDLVHTLSCQFYNMTNSYQSNALILPKTVQEFNVKFCEKTESVYDPNTIRYDEPETVDDIKVATIVTLIHSTMCCCQDKTSLSIQLYEIYKDFPERLLSLAMHKVRSDQLISHNKINSSTRKAHKSCLPLSSSSYHLSATYQQQMTTKISYDLFDESFAMLQEMSDDLSARKEPHILNLLNTEVCFFITELLHKQSYDVSIEIPKRLLLLDPSKRLPDESFQGIYARFHEIFNYIPKIDLVGGDDNGLDEFLMETNNDEKPTPVNQTAQIIKKLENFPADILHIFCIIDNYGVTKPRNQLQLDDDGQCPLDCIKQFTNPFDHIMDKLLAKREVWYRLNVEQQELAPLPAVVTIDEFNVVAVYNFLVSKGSTVAEEERTDNLEKFKQLSDIVDEMLLENDKDLIDEDFDAEYDLRSDMKKKLYDGNQINDKIHKFHDFLCINTCKLSLEPKIDENDNIDLERLHKKREDLLAKIVRDANWSAEFKSNKDFVELMLSEGLSMAEVHIAIDILNHIDAAGEKGSTAASLTDKYEDNEFLEMVLSHLNEHKLVMKTGVCEVTFVHWKHIKPWIVNTYHLKRLERESIAPTNKSLMQVSSEPSTSKGLKRKHNDTAVVKAAKVKGNHLEMSTDDMEIDSIDNSSDSEMEDIVGATVTLIQTEQPNETTANETTKPITSKHRKKLSQMSVEYGEEVGPQFASQTKKTFPLKIAPWIRVNGSINRRVLDKYAGTILLHCIENAGLTLFTLCTRFHYLLPIHVHELVEYLEGFECITKTAIPKQKPATLFSKYESFDIGSATALDDFKNIIIEPNIDAVTKMSIFIGRKKYKEDFI